MRCFERLPDTSTTRHFGIKTLWDTSAPISRHFDTSAVIEEKPGHFDQGQFQWDTAPPVIRLKLRHQFCGAEVSCGRNVRLHFQPRYNTCICKLAKASIHSLDFAVNKLFMKLSKTTNIEIIKYYQEQFDFHIPSELIPRRTEKFHSQIASFNSYNLVSSYRTSKPSYVKRLA